MTDQDYLKPVRTAADNFAWRLEVGDISRQEARDILIEFAGAILDAVRVEARLDANRRALEDSGAPR